MTIFFGRQLNHDYEEVERLPNVGDIQHGRNGVDEKCVSVSPAFWGYKYPEDETYKKYAPYIAKWKEQTEDGAEYFDRICIKRDEYLL